jgi:hypothetical protein
MKSAQLSTPIFATMVVRQMATVTGEQWRGQRDQSTADR